MELKDQDTEKIKMKQGYWYDVAVICREGALTLLQIRKNPDGTKEFKEVKVMDADIENDEAMEFTETFYAKLSKYE